MEKVYLVIGEYWFDGVECEVEVFTSKEDAKQYFKEKVEKEKKNSWIKHIADGYMADLEFDLNKLYFHAFSVNDYYETTIYVKEKEVK
jgi:hypothetical protein